jgi:hypothetical protein
MKSIDFSKGVRGKYSGMDLRVVGDKTENSETAWAICITSKEKSLIPLKLYQVEVFSESNEIEVVDEKAEKIACPKDYFLLLKLMKKDVDLLNSVAV